MRKNLSRIVLGISLAGMMVVGICLNNIYNEEIELNDISGDRSALGDMSILFQRRGGFYETDEILINKDEIHMDRFVKQGYYLTNMDNKNVENRDLLECSSGENLIFEDDDEIGTVYVSDVYDEDDICETNANITIKNKNNGSFDIFDISLGESINDKGEFIFATVPIKKEDILYIVTARTDVNENYNEIAGKENLSDYYVKTTINLYKLNLSNKTSKHLINKEYKGKELNIISEIAFSKGDKVYFLVNKRNSLGEKYKTALFEFDIVTKDINTIDLGENLLENFGEVRKYYLDEENVLISTTHTKEDKEYAKLVSLNLNDKKLKYIYNVDLNFSSKDSNIMQIRRDSGKIYIISHGQMKDDEMDKTSYVIQVIDESSGKNLYTGNIKLYSDYSVNGGLVKKGEF